MRPRIRNISLLVAVFLAGLLVGPGACQTSFQFIPDGAEAVTYCDTDGQVTSAFRHGILEDSITRAEVMAHEAKHREQFNRFPSCRLAQRAFTSSVVVRLNFEGEAYCAGVKAAIAAGGDPAKFEFETYAVMLQVFLVQGVPAQVIEDTLVAYGCRTP